MRFRIRNKITGHTTLAEWDSVEYQYLITDTCNIPWDMFGESGFWEACDIEMRERPAPRFLQLQRGKYINDEDWKRLEKQVNRLLDEAQLLMNIQNQIINNKYKK